MDKWGLLLVNLGTPESPLPKDVGNYLKEFLMDPYVLDVPRWLRYILVNILIVPRRKFKSAEAYEKIWTKRGSPLKFHLIDLKSEIDKLKDDALTVEVAMRYGQPDMQLAINKFIEQGIKKIRVLPLYPQYALSSTETARQKLKYDIKGLENFQQIEWLNYFYDFDEYIKCFKRRVLESVNMHKPDYLLFSFHGLPERHITKLNSECLKEKCCDVKSDRSAKCYRYQSFQTAKLIMNDLGVQIPWSVAFQSRLTSGWLKPFTDYKVMELAKSGVKKLMICSPSFVADCLETIEEISVRETESFIQEGGASLSLVPSLNAEPDWANAILNLCSNSKNWVRL